MAHGPILNALANPTVSLGLGSVALLGPGRPLIKDGLLSLIRSATCLSYTLQLYGIVLLASEPSPTHSQDVPRRLELLTEFDDAGEIPT